MSAEWRIEKPIGTIPNILLMEKNELNLFAGDISRAYGNVRILIHPFYRENMEPDPYDQARQYSHSNLVRDSLINCDLPSLIFEDPDSVDSTNLRVQFSSRKNCTYFVTTKHDNPTPTIPGLHITDEQAWEYLLNQLHLAGVKKCELGGRELYHLSNGRAGGCVLVAYERLCEKFNTRLIGNLCYPDNII